MPRQKDGKLEPHTKAHHDPSDSERHKKARHEMHPGHRQYVEEHQGTSRRPSRATRGAPQYRDLDDSSPSSDDDEEDDFRVESRQRRITDRDSDDGDSGNEIEEEEEVPVQYGPQGAQQAEHLGGRDIGFPKVFVPNVPQFVQRVNYKAPGMTKTARLARRQDPRGEAA